MSMYMQSQSLTIRHEWELTYPLVLQQMAELHEGDKPCDITLVREFPMLNTVTEFMFLGSFSWVAGSGKWKMISDRHAVNTAWGWSTPAGLARDYVRAKYGRAGRLSTPQYNEIIKHRQAPLYASPGIYPDAVYIDLKSAYWSILQVIGWDVDYYPGRFMSVKSDVRDFPYWRNKLARNCLVSIGLSGQSKAWDGEKLVFQRKRNALTNYMLWSAVQDTLHAIAADMVRVGAVYVHTDGYIVPRTHYDAAMNVFDEWGLVGTVRDEGEMNVITVGTYAAPKKPNNRMANMRPRAFNGIHPVHPRWLKQRFSRFSRRLTLILA